MIVDYRERSGVDGLEAPKDAWKSRERIFNARRGDTVKQSCRRGEQRRREMGATRRRRPDDNLRNVRGTPGEPCKTAAGLKYPLAISNTDRTKVRRLAANH
jgi:hypothetical protein